MTAEAADLTKAMRELLMISDRFVYLGGVVATGALLLGVLKHDEKRNWIVLVFAPYALALTFGYLLQLYTEIERRAGYKRYLEDRVNQQIGVPILLESKVNSQRFRNRASVRGMQALHGSGFLVLSVLGVRETMRFDTRGPSVLGLHMANWHYLNIVLLAGVVAVLLKALVETARANEQAYGEADRAARHHD